MLMHELLVRATRLLHPHDGRQVRGGDALPPLLARPVAIHECVVLGRDIDATVLAHAPISVLLDAALKGRSKDCNLRLDLPEPLF